MSLTVSNPKSIAVSTWFPSNADLVYTMSSTNSTVTGFYYLIDVFVNSTKVVTLRKYPIQGVTTSLNVRDIVNAYISSSFTANTSPQYVNYHTTITPDWCEFHVTVTEWYNGEDWDSVTTIPMYAWDAAIQFEQMLTPDIQAYSRYFTYDENYQSSSYPLYYHGIPMGWKNYIQISTADGLLNRRGALSDICERQAYKLVRGDKRQLSIFCGYNLSSNTEVNYLIAYGFNSIGKFIKKAAKNITNIDGRADRHWINYNLTGGTEAYWDFTIDNNGMAFFNMSDCQYIYYCFSKKLDESMSTMEKVSYGILVEVCDFPESYSVLYKSYEGGWRHIQLNRRNTKTTEVKTITRQNVAPIYYEVSTRLVTPVRVQAQSKLMFHTDWVNEGVNEEIQDMLISPCLYIQHYKDGNTTFTPVTLEDATYTTEQVNDVNLFNYSFTFIESFEKNTILQ